MLINNKYSIRLYYLKLKLHKILKVLIIYYIILYKYNFFNILKIYTINRISI